MPQFMRERESKAIAWDFLVHEKQRREAFNSEAQTIHEIGPEARQNNYAAGIFNQIDNALDRSAWYHPICS